MDSATKFVLGMIAVAALLGVLGSAIPSLQFWILVGGLIAALIYGVVRIGKLFA